MDYVISEPGKKRRTVSEQEYKAHVEAQQKARAEQIAKERKAREDKARPAPPPSQPQGGDA